MLASLQGHAYDFDVNGIYYNKTGDSTVEVTYVENGAGNSDFYSGSITIPRRVSKDNVTYTVTAIGDYAFRSCGELTGVSIPDVVTSIGSYAFSGCKKLGAVSLPSSVTTIGDCAFYGCCSLTSMTFPEGVQSIGNSAIGSDDVAHAYIKLTDLYLPSTLVEINTDMLGELGEYGGTEIENVRYNGTLSDWCNKMDGWYKGGMGKHLYLKGTLLKEVTIPSGVTVIPSSAFRGNQDITTVTIPATVISIGDQAFHECINLESVSLPDNGTLEVIPHYCFTGCTKLSSINIPASVKTFAGQCTFAETAFSSFVVPETVTTLSEYMFRDCTSLKSLTIKGNINKFPTSICSGCYNLKALVLDNDTPPAFQEMALDNTTCYIFVPENSVEDYKNADGWSDYADRIMPQTGWTFTAAVPCGDGTTELVFKVTNANPWEVEVSGPADYVEGALTIPATVMNAGGIDFTVKGIGYEAFQAQRGITSVVLPEGLTYIMDRGFNECSGITSVTLPSTLTEMYQGAFMNCGALKSIALPDALTTIAFAAFQSSGLEIVTLPNKLEIIENDAFRHSALKSVKFPATLTSVGIAAFRECSSLKSVDFNGCTATVEAECFIGTAIENITVPATVNLDGWTVFGWCQELVSARIEAAREGYEIDDLFRSCGKLQNVVLYSTQCLGIGSFIDCTSLKTVTILNGDAGKYNYFQIFKNVPDDVMFTIPEGTAESFLKKGYRLLSDLSGLPLVREEFEAEATRINKMADALTDGDKDGLAASINEARTAVNGAEDYATVYAQIDAIKTAAKQFLATATLPHGFDVTAAYIINPDFDQFQLGWTVPGGNNTWGWTDSSYENGNVSIDRFIEAWHYSYDLEDGEFVQTIKSFPAGVYRLEADVIASNDDGMEVTGASLFGGSRSMAVATENDKPQHFTLKFENPTTKDINIGLKLQEATASKVAVDNFRLYYEGQVASVPTGSELVSSETDTVYIYNVGAQQFLNAGNSWGMHAVLDDNGLPVRMTQNADGRWNVYFYQGARAEQLLARFENSREGVSEQEEVYVDYNGQGDERRNWIVSDDGNGGYLIQNQVDQGTGYFLGNMPHRNDYNSQTWTTLDTHIDVVCTDDATANIHWQFISKADYDLLTAKRRLMATIIRAEENNLASADLLSSAMTVYNNPDATLAEVIEATTNINSQIGMPQKDQPVDMTSLIVNPRFENELPEGWTGAKGVSTGNAQNTQHQTHEFFNTTFNMSQTITGVPNGLYRLRYKGFHRPGDSWQTACADYAAGKNDASAEVYANSVAKTLPHICKGYSSERLHSDDVEYNGQFLPNQQWDGRLYFDRYYYSDYIEVEVTDNQLTIGVRSTDNMDDGAEWVLFSDFELEIIENAETYHNKLVETLVRAVTGYTVTLPIDMENADDITSVEFMVELPHYSTIIAPHDYLTFATDEYNDPIITPTERTKGFSVSATAVDSTHCKVLIYGIGKKITKGSGTIVNLQVKVADDSPYWPHGVELYDIVLGKSNGLGVKPFSTTSVVNVQWPEQGDANHDMVVSVADIITVASHILNRNPQPFDTWAADINGDNDINAIDISQLANLILYGTPTLSRSTEPAADGFPVSTARHTARAAENGDTFAVDNVTLDADGKGILDVNLNNSTASAGYEFELRLPEGISIATDSYGDFVYEEGTRVSAVAGFVTSISQRDGYYKVLCFNDKTRAMQGNSGTVITITLQSDGKVGGQMSATLTNCRISDTFKTDYLLNEELPFTIDAGGLKGDVNNDGQVGIGDIVAVTNFMAGNPGSVTLADADVNGDGEVGIGDIVAITNIMAGMP